MSAGNTVDKSSSRRARRAAAKQVAKVEAEIDEQERDEEEERAITPSKGRATPGRRVQEHPEKRGNFITRAAGSVREYFEGVNSELRKVAWPTREDTRRLTTIVIVVMVVSSIVLGLIGLGFTELFRLGLVNPLIFFIFFAVVAVGGFILYRRSQRGDTPPY